MQPENYFMSKAPFWIFILLLVVYFTGIRVNTMDIDASQYADISLEMSRSHDWLQVYDQGRDYLDKPPFLFWVSAASIKVFGANNLGFKFPSILFGIWAIYATYRLAKKLYNENTARVSALVLATCQGMFLMENDIRTDTILMSWVVTAIWLLKEWDDSGKIKYLLGGSAAIGFGMMTKGPIALFVPAFSFVSQWVLKREWKKFLRPALLLGIVVIGILLIPMSIGLYQQFDLHPEKTVNELKNVSGLRFFYWSQSFGRITGESPWKNEVDITFLLSNMLWSFLPWIFVFLPAVVINIIRLFKERFSLSGSREWLTMGGFWLSYMALGSSAYQLPHYIFVAFPLASIVVGAFLTEAYYQKQYAVVFKVLRPALTVVSFLVFVLAFVMCLWVFPASIFMIALLFVGVIVWFYLVFKTEKSEKLIVVPASAMAIANIFLMNCTYPSLLNYQLGNTMGDYLKEHHIAAKELAIYKPQDAMNSIYFYSGEKQTFTEALSQVAGKKYILTMQKGYPDIAQLPDKYKVLKEGEYFKVTELTPEFLNPKTRHNVCGHYYLLEKQ